MSKQRFDSIWDAIEDTPQQAASMRVRADLMLALQKWVKASNQTQAHVARLLGVTQPRISDLMRGRIDLFSTDTLLDMAATAGLSPTIKVRVPKTKASRDTSGVALAA